MPEKSRGPDYARLVADLAELRAKGLTQVRTYRFAALEEAARVSGLASASTGSAQSAVEKLLKAAVSRIGGEMGAAAAYTFGVEQGTRGWTAPQRRKVAAEKYGVSIDHFRKNGERLIFEQVAEEILAYVQQMADGAAAGGAGSGDPAEPDEYDRPGSPPVDAPTTMRPVIGSEPFAGRLADAVSATIVDPTNADLAGILEAALRVKRERLGETAFWDDLRVVFLDDDLLELVRDDLTVQFPDPAEATRERRRRAGLARRMVMSLLLRQGVPGRWSLHTHQGLITFPGAIFHMNDGRTIVHFTASPSHRLGPGALRFEFDDRPDHHFESLFNEVVEVSGEQNEVVLVGRPTGGATGFTCHSARFRRGVMNPRQNQQDWLPAVIVISWRERDGIAEPLLEINTPNNSTRELGKASHLSGYVNQRDCVTHHGQKPENSSSSFALQPAMAETAVRRELRDELGVDDLSRAPRLAGTVPFYYPDKENLFFYLFEVELGPDTAFAPSTHMYPWKIGELLRIREHQVVNNAILALTAEPLTLSQRRIATKIASRNLRIHGHFSLAERVETGFPEGPARPEPVEDLVEELNELSLRSRFVRYSAGRELYIGGLAGLQYRGFFTDILPVYADVAVPGARELLAELNSDPDRRRAMHELKEIYENEELITALPIEV